MTPAWIVVRTESHVEDRYWVFERKEDAIFVAKAFVAYWAEKYGPARAGCVDTGLYETLAYHVNMENAFRVYVQPIFVRSPGEIQKEESHG